MDSDLMLVIGIILGVLSIPAMLNAFSESRAPRMPAIIVLIAGILVFLALRESPNAYSWEKLPQVFARVFGRLFN
jgi:sugar phosphate permease